MNRIIKGLFIGISYVLPGVCSSTTASVFGEYENILEFTSKFYSIKIIKGTSLVIQWLRPCAPNTGGLGFDPCSGNKIPHVTTMTKCSQINKYF